MGLVESILWRGLHFCGKDSSNSSYGGVPPMGKKVAGGDVFEEKKDWELMI